MPQYSSNRTSLYYDPYRQGFDTNEWRPLWGSPTSDNNRIILPGGGAIIHYSDIQKGDVNFNVNFSTAPNGGGAVNTTFGLYQPLRGSFIGFYGDGTGLYARVTDGTNTTTADEITWDSDWTNVNTNFRFVWEAGIVKFFCKQC